MARRKTAVERATDRLTEAEFDALTMQHYQQGLAAGRADAVGRTCNAIEEKAGQAFLAGRDEKALWLRELAAEVRKIK